MFINGAWNSNDNNNYYANLELSMRDHNMSSDSCKQLLEQRNEKTKNKNSVSRWCKSTNKGKVSNVWLYSTDKILDVYRDDSERRTVVVSDIW